MPAEQQTSGGGLPSTSAAHEQGANDEASSRPAVTDGASPNLQAGSNDDVEQAPEEPSGSGAGDDDLLEEIREQDRFLPIANVGRIMKNALPSNAKISKDAKECVQDSVSEFISFITSEAADRCAQEKRKTITGDDIVYCMEKLGFDNISESMSRYLQRYRDFQSSNNAPQGNGFQDPNGAMMAMAHMMMPPHHANMLPPQYPAPGAINHHDPSMGHLSGPGPMHPGMAAVSMAPPSHIGAHSLPMPTSMPANLPPPTLPPPTLPPPPLPPQTLPPPTLPPNLGNQSMGPNVDLNLSNMNMIHGIPEPHQGQHHQ